MQRLKLLTLAIGGAAIVGIGSFSAYAGIDGHGPDGAHHAEMPSHDHGQAHKGHGGHAHDAWVAAPASYAGKTWSGWSDEAVAEQGKAIYQQQCAYCHGDDGKGTGPLAGRLAHPPADLTSNFHTAPGKGDDYLFWRVSEGGRVEPFRSQESAMPAFGNTLDESSRWAVLTYVHQAFHGGFLADTSASPAHGEHHHGPRTMPSGHAH